MAIVQKDQVAIALNRLLEQFKDKPNIAGMLTAYVEQTNDLEDCYFQLLNERSIYTAIGVQLDILGALVGEVRNGKNDEEYRLAILNRVAINTSEGTPNQVLSILKNTTGATKVNVWEHFPVSAIYYANVEYIGSNIAASIVQESSPATSENAVIIYDPYELSFTPSELSLQEFTIVDDVGNLVVDNEGNLISAQYYENVQDSDLALAELSEIVPSTLDITYDIEDEGLLISSDGISEVPLEIWSTTSSIEETPYGVLPEVAIIEN